MELLHLNPKPFYRLYLLINLGGPLRGSINLHYCWSFPVQLGSGLKTSEAHLKIMKETNMLNVKM